MNLTPFRQTGSRGPQTDGSSALSDSDGLSAFGSESEPVPSRVEGSSGGASASPFRLRLPQAVLPLAVVGVVGIATGAAGMWLFQRGAALTKQASLKIETSVPGAEVLLAGKSAGRTPVSLALAPGSYAVQLAANGVRRDFRVDLAGGSSVVRHLDLPAAVATTGTPSGSLLVQTEPARLTVSVDGVERGVSPLTLTGLAPGEHQVAIRGEGAVVRRTVTIQPNEHTVLVVSPVERTPSGPAPGAAGGFLAVASSLPLTIREGGKLLGTTDAERLMLPAGEHALELSNEGLGLQVKRTVRIEPGKTAALKIDPPNGVLSINAQPWAEVWVDGQRIGETPIGNLARTIGQHEVVLRHPDLGERRETVTVTLRGPARLGVDMRRK